MKTSRTPNRQVSRRTVAKGAAWATPTAVAAMWATPAVAPAASVPAVAASCLKKVNWTTVVNSTGVADTNGALKLQQGIYVNLTSSKASTTAPTTSPYLQVSLNNQSYHSDHNDNTGRVNTLHPGDPSLMMQFDGDKSGTVNGGTGGLDRQNICPNYGTGATPKNPALVGDRTKYQAYTFTFSQKMKQAQFAIYNLSHTEDMYIMPGSPAPNDPGPPDTGITSTVPSGAIPVAITQVSNGLRLYGNGQGEAASPANAIITITNVTSFTIYYGFGSCSNSDGWAADLGGITVTTC